MTRGSRRLLFLLATGGALAACGPTATPRAGEPSSVPTPAPQATASLVSPGGPPGPATAVAIDPTLLDLLPTTVDGLPLTENAEAEAASLRDPVLARVALAFAAALVVDPSGGAFVYAVVVRLLPGAMDEAVFRDWRDSYDEGACSQAGGVAGNAETELAGRTVYIGTCTGGVTTYHVWLGSRGVLISASAAGERRLGELLVESLRP